MCDKGSGGWGTKGREDKEEHTQIIPWEPLAHPFQQHTRVQPPLQRAGALGRCTKSMAGIPVLRRNPCSFGHWHPTVPWPMFPHPKLVPVRITLGIWQQEWDTHISGRTSIFELFWSSFETNGKREDSVFCFLTAQEPLGFRQPALQDLPSSLNRLGAVDVDFSLPSGSHALLQEMPALFILFFFLT